MIWNVSISKNNARCEWVLVEQSVSGGVTVYQRVGKSHIFPLNDIVLRSKWAFKKSLIQVGGP